MLLTIDIGNTNITLGAYRDEKLLFVSRMFTARNKTSDEFAAELLNIFKLYEVGATEFSKVVMSCVVPEIEDSVIRAVKMITGKKPAIVGAENHGSFKIDILPLSLIHI